MSYRTPTIASLTLRGIDNKIQSLASHMPSTATGGIAWLETSFALADRLVEFRDGKEFIFPAVFQDINSKDPHSCMPNDMPDAFSFWIKDDMRISDNNPARSYYKISCIFYMDLRQIAPTDNFKTTKTKVRQDILEFFRKHRYSGFGVLTPTGIIDEDITNVYKGYSVNQLDNIVKQLPKYALRFNFDFAFLNECGNTNSYA
jgi:hypothetical protein